MIHLPLKDRDVVPGRLTCPNALTLIRQVTNQTDGNLCSTTFYGDTTVTLLLRSYSIHKTALEVADKPKCNYCESQLEKGLTLQVEHYRPKAKVDPKDTNGLVHVGYYWLGMEWTNLLLACPRCNGRSGKGNRFPVRNVRASHISPVDLNNALDRTGCFAHLAPLITESPLLLNPEVDFPEDYLTFDLQGNIFGHGHDAERGEVTKEILGLNRPSLVAARIEVWNDFKNDITLDIAAHLIQEIGGPELIYCFKKTCRKLIKRKLPTEEFTLWGRYINNSINEFILADIPLDYREIFRTAYSETLALNNPV